ncbi:hypothetical protein BDV26DRAFT_258408 [Aspergillus bertholletiae]|uniref:Uncharacterized protein n=1 Tax=Aspergillus bertholletiae TaxID=1226010 RepID=A0A5N7BDL0_9EURO|nr:hypothetical protein BDV26DRAFT_258408 [Aspergillus bertholletiae]
MRAVGYSQLPLVIEQATSLVLTAATHGHASISLSSIVQEHHYPSFAFQAHFSCFSFSSCSVLLSNVQIFVLLLYSFPLQYRPYG